MSSSAKILQVSAVAATLVLVAAGGHAQSEIPAPLGDGVRAAVEEAFLDELRGEAIYARVLKDHGDVRPFSNVVRAERQHAAFLEGVLKARGLAVPAPPSGEVPAYASLEEACVAAVAFERRNVALYDRLLTSGPLPDDVRRAFDHNRAASLDHHQPAFERCAGAGAAPGAGADAGPGAGHGGGRGAPCGHRCGHGCGHCGRGHGHGAHGCGRS